MSYCLRYLLGLEKTLIIRGPASVRLIEGHANALNAPLVGRKFVVRREKQLPVQATSDAVLEVILGESGTLFEVTGSTIPRSWYSALDAIVEMKEGRIVIIGATDVGKSTLSTFLANGLFKEQISCQIVDADIGQADIGPPTTIGSAVTSSFLPSLVELDPSALIFVGDTSPNRVQSKLLDGIQRLSKNEEAKLTIINTDGWVLDREAIIYKTRLIETVRPDLVLAIASFNELDPIVSGASAISMRIEAPTMILSRSQRDRRQIRTSGYRRFLDGGATRAYGKQTIRLKLPLGVSSIETVGRSQLRNLLVGLLDEDGLLLQIGVLLGLDDISLRVYSRAVDHVATIEVSCVKLSTDGVELGYLEL
jgi:polynucleotide 5'-hydroxyl-kinase GRC3/NOL9